jgi:hypothetical protein
MVWQTMNERIRQLLSQAGVHYEVLPKDTVYEKFAELIVRECLSQVDKMDAILEDDKEKTGVAWVGLAIAKHFGVGS